jgi:hypothetical protein
MAADFALGYLNAAAPSHVMAGEVNEIRTWQNRMMETLKYLVARGGRSGSGVPMTNSLQLAEIADLVGFKNMNVYLRESRHSLLHPPH